MLLWFRSVQQQNVIFSWAPIVTSVNNIFSVNTYKDNWQIVWLWQYRGWTNVVAVDPIIGDICSRGNIWTIYDQYTFNNVCAQSDQWIIGDMFALVHINVSCPFCSPRTTSGICSCPKLQHNNHQMWRMLPYTMLFTTLPISWSMVVFCTKISKSNLDILLHVIVHCYMYILDK